MESFTVPNIQDSQDDVGGIKVWIYSSRVRISFFSAIDFYSDIFTRQRYIKSCLHPLPKKYLIYLLARTQSNDKGVPIPGIRN